MMRLKKCGKIIVTNHNKNPVRVVGLDDTCLPWSNLCCHIIMKSDILNTLRKMKIGKPVRPNDITIEVWKCGRKENFIAD